MRTILKKCTERVLLVSNTILFVFEGEKIEGQIFESLKAHFFPPSDEKPIVKSSFRSEIFQLWKKIKDDVDLDIVEILKERPNSGIEDIKRKDVSEVHLFFDHDAHSHHEVSRQEYNNNIIDLLNTFNDEFGMGKLWISYPMSEALKHCKKNENNSFEDTLVKITDNTNYKEFVSKITDYSDIRRYDKPTWYYLTNINIERSFSIVNGTYGTIHSYSQINEWFEKNAIIVNEIHEKQYTRFICPKNEVAVLSPFPLFLLYYFGKPFFDDCKGDKTNE